MAVGRVISAAKGEHVFKRATKDIAAFAVADDLQALDAFPKISRLEGILPALEPSHALAHILTIAPDLPKDHMLVLKLCGRGDKDRDEVVRLLGEPTV